MALAGTAVNEGNVRNLQDMLMTYNKITEACFTKCVSNMNYKDLTEKEAICVNRCAGKFINGSHCIMSTFMEIQGRKQQEMMADAAKQNEQVTIAAAQTAAPPVDTAANDSAEVPISLSSTQSDSVSESTVKL